jgi:hypothetical protein
VCSSGSVQWQDEGELHRIWKEEVAESKYYPNIYIRRETKGIRFKLRTPGLRVWSVTSTSTQSITPEMICSCKLESFKILKFIMLTVPNIFSYFLLSVNYLLSVISSVMFLVMLFV